MEPGWRISRTTGPPGSAVTRRNGPTPTPDGHDQGLTRCLSLDLEVGRADDRIHALAGVRPDTGQSVAVPKIGRNLDGALANLDELANGTDFLLGHNLIGFDMPHLRAAAPGLRLLDLAAVDTLRLNPLAFPRNPYHHLVKHYQDGSLIRGRLNDPELDARLVLEVFDNQRRAFRETRPELLTAWHWLTTVDGGPGFDLFFSSVRQSAKPAGAEGTGRHPRLPGGQRVPGSGEAGRGGCAGTGLGAGLRSGVVVGVREQLGDAALGPPPVPWSGTPGQAAAGPGLR